MTKLLLSVVVVKFKSKTPKLANLIVVDNDKVNRGFAKAVNLGIKKALAKKAEAILLLNPDLKITAEQILALSKTAEDIVGPVLTFDRQGKRIYDFGGRVNFVLGRTTHLENIAGKIDYVSGACMLIKKRVFEKIGLFDQRFFMYLEDVDFCLRAKKAGFTIAINTSVVVEHQISEHRYSHDQFKLEQNLKSNWKFINKWVPWYFKPTAYIYWLYLWLRIH